MHECAILVPIYRWPLSLTEAYSVHKTITILKEHDIFWIGPESLSCTAPAKYMEKSIGFVDFKNKFFNSITSYNRLLMSRFFYKKFEKYSHVLIVQPDALVFRDEVDKWCSSGYSYIGAPWFSGMNNLNPKYDLLSVGNGGFSLRRIQDFIKFLSVPRNIPISLNKKKKNILFKIFDFFDKKIIFCWNFYPLTPRINEDLFWSLAVSKYRKLFREISPLDALDFAYEVAPREMHNLNEGRLPFGCHAWEKYDKEFWLQKIGGDFFHFDASVLDSLTRG